MIDPAKRKRVMQRSIKLGHCICNPKQACPCDEFKELNICHCAGERRETDEGPVRLTTLVENPGCASKIDQASLKAVLAGLPDVDHPDVLVGAPAGDDAGIFRIGEKSALVQTVDVFCPSIDDPYTFGRIAAANSLSDVYAMGGRPLTALSVVGFPIHDAPPSAMKEILRGGIDKMAEAGVPVLGGHSINDSQIKAGFAVTGLVDPDRIVTNAGALPGDRLVLTKPIGTGMTAFAGQMGVASAEALTAIAESMTTLNRTASELMVEFGAHAATDVTGFGIAGHLSEMARAGGVDVEVVWDDVPLFPGVTELIARGVFPGAIERNRESSEKSIDADTQLTREMLEILFDAQTSGGLLIAIGAEKVDEFVERLRASGVKDAAVIATVTGKGSGRVRVKTTGKRKIPVIESVETEQNEDKITPAEHPLPGGAEHRDPEEVNMTDADECCPGGAGAGSLEGIEEAWKAFMQRTSSPAGLDVTTKQAVNVALSLAVRCGPCAKTHIKKALEMGFTKEEIDELAWQATSFGGCTVKMFYNQFRP
jgi:selenide,water dikinase